MYPKIESELNFGTGEVRCNCYKNKMQQIKEKEVSCQRFFPRTTKMTRDFLDRMHVAKLTKVETYVLENESKFRTISVIAALVILFLFSFFGIFFMWYTDGFNNILYSNMVLRESNPGFQIWRKPTLDVHMKVYLFNYTNVERYEEGTDDKLNVEQKGPYVYKESMERVNLKFSGNQLSYQIKKSYKFIPELSKGRQNDIVVVPNMFLLAATALNRNANIFTRIAVASGLSGIYSKTFLSLPADRFIMGYEDNFYSISKSIMSFQDVKMADQIGLLSKNLGVGEEVYTIHTGQGDVDKIGKILNIDQKERVNFWSTEECNRFTDSTDGCLFSPIAVRHKKPVKIYNKDLCRNVELVFKRESTVLDGDIPAYTYEVSDNFLDSPDYYPENQCYCEMDGGTCAPQGLFNNTLCASNAPIFMSYPHFYRADPSLTEKITGLNPNGSEHVSTAQLHPTMGFPMSGNMRLQVNMQILKISEFSQLSRYEDEQILPLAWFDVSMQDKDLPQEMRDIIETSIHTVALVKNILKYGSIILAILTLIPIAANIKYKMTKNERRDSTRPLRKVVSEVDAQI